MSTIIGTSLERRAQRVKSTNQTGLDVCQEHGICWAQRVAISTLSMVDSGVEGKGKKVTGRYGVLLQPPISCPK
jgi:hypothetical protein